MFLHLVERVQKQNKIQCQCVDGDILNTGFTKNLKIINNLLKQSPIFFSLHKKKHWFIILLDMP